MENVLLVEFVRMCLDYVHIFVGIYFIAVNLFIDFEIACVDVIEIHRSFEIVTIVDSNCSICV